LSYPGVVYDVKEQLAHLWTKVLVELGVDLILAGGLFVIRVADGEVELGVENPVVAVVWPVTDLAAVFSSYAVGRVCFSSLSFSCRSRAWRRRSGL
jgi:hypothetical protein